LDLLVTVFWHPEPQMTCLAASHILRNWPEIQLIEAEDALVFPLRWGTLPSCSDTFRHAHALVLVFRTFYHVGILIHRVVFPLTFLLSTWLIKQIVTNTSIVRQEVYVCILGVNMLQMQFIRLLQSATASGELLTIHG
jgi:hypothetical protein